MEQSILSVSELVKSLKVTVESQFPFIAVRGEATNIKTAFSGHTYFSLKDKESQIRCAIFSRQKAALHVPLVEDREYIIWGRISLYEARSEITLVVSLVVEAGEGEAALKLKALKEKLAKEGLFDPSRKKMLPHFCEHIGVVTSESGAAIHDIIRVGRNRYPRLRITLCPALVQGEKADISIVKALETLAAVPDIDAIIVGRGGGSKEDLAAFNSEALARAVVACPIPVVAAVGHEIDLTLLDLAADASVSTPSAAAERLTEPAADILDTVGNSIALSRERITGHLREQAMRLDRAMLSFPNPMQWISGRLLRVSNAEAQLSRSINLHLNNLKELFSEHNTLLETLSPLRPLEQGWTLVRQNGKVIKRLTHFNTHHSFSMKFHDGEIIIVPEINEEKKQKN